MTSTAWKSVNAPEAATGLVGAQFCHPTTAPVKSPIDSYYGYAQSVVIIGQPQAVADNPALGRLLLLGFVSATDNYFRNVLAGLISICPLSRTRVREKQIQFGSLDYYDRKSSPMALFEHTSFASVEDVKKKTNEVAGADVLKSPSLVAALRQLELLCHMRHAATHAGGVLSSRNAHELGLPAEGQSHSVVASFGQLQEAVSVCQSAVRAYNRWLFEQVANQWIGQKILNGDWWVDKPLLSPLFSHFYSRSDGLVIKSAYQAHQSMRKAILDAQ